MNQSGVFSRAGAWAETRASVKVGGKVPFATQLFFQLCRFLWTLSCPSHANPLYPELLPGVTRLDLAPLSHPPAPLTISSGPLGLGAFFSLSGLPFSISVLQCWITSCFRPQGHPLSDSLPGVVPSASPITGGTRLKTPYILYLLSLPHLNRNWMLFIV